jgi:signal peptidase II
VSKPKLIFLFLIFLIIIFDLLSKALVAHFMSSGESLLVLGNFFKLTYVLNEGGAFGSRLGGGLFYTFTSILAIILTSYFFFKSSGETLLELSLCLVLGGALGNLFDRLRFGKVVDFLDFDFFNFKFPPFKFLFIDFPGYQMERWPVFNLADSAITIGMILLVIYFFLPKKSTSSLQQDAS